MSIGYLPYGYEGIETIYEQALWNRGITHEQQQTKIDNLRALARSGLRVIKPINHDKYTIEGVDGFYNPYTNQWSQE